MFRRRLGYALLCCVLALPVFAAEDDGVMGNWQGEYTSGEKKGAPLAAKVIANSDIKWQFLLYPEPDVRAESSIEGIKRRDGITFEGTADVGGEQPVSAQITAPGEMVGAIGAGRDSVSFELKRVHLTSPTYNAAPPEGAIVLISPDVFDMQPHPLNWSRVEEDAVQVTHSSLISKVPGAGAEIATFGSAEIHVEFRTPFMPDARGQARGNSGVYVHGRYEVQVLDSFGIQPADNLCGGIYKHAIPAADATYPPLAWQTYDITFTAPQFDESGAKVASARITVVHNGVTIHDNVELPEPTPGGYGGAEAPEGPLLFQNHGDGVRFRNVWVKPLN